MFYVIYTVEENLVISDFERSVQPIDLPRILAVRLDIQIAPQSLLVDYNPKGYWKVSEILRKGLSAGTVFG
jgi:hypothetical protein